MGPTPVYGAKAENPLQNADFAMKQTNICRLSGDIIIIGGYVPGPMPVISSSFYSRPTAMLTAAVMLCC